MFEAMENPPRALLWYKKALKHDPFCYEAFHALVERHLLNNADEKQLVYQLELTDEDSWLQLLYSCKCKKVCNAATNTFLCDLDKHEVISHCRLVNNKNHMKCT